jgi:hypothetical protein
MIDGAMRDDHGAVRTAVAGWIVVVIPTLDEEQSSAHVFRAVPAYLGRRSHRTGPARGRPLSNFRCRRGGNSKSLPRVVVVRKPLLAPPESVLSLSALGAGDTSRAGETLTRP